MKRQPAKALTPEDVRQLLGWTRGRRHAHRDRVIILLSFKAGLRACEIAGLDWAMVLDSSGAIADCMVLGCGITKGGRARMVPVNRHLRVALDTLHRSHGRPVSGPVIRSERGGAMSARSVVNWFRTLYARAGLAGCSSHSGRRTFITRSARVLARSGGSLRDIQLLAGHRSISTTERYIEGDSASQRKLVNML